jgi:hypothetical protein
MNDAPLPPDDPVPYWPALFPAGPDAADAVRFGLTPQAEAALDEIETEP